MKATIITELYDAQGKPIRKNEQPAHSFVYNMVKFLYCHFAHTSDTITDVLDTPRTIDTPSADPVKGNLCISSTPGLVLMPIMHGSNNAISPMMFPGEYYGIQIGTGTTPVSAFDTKLEARLSQYVKAEDAIVYEKNITGDTGDGEIYGSYWRGMTWKLMKFLHNYYVFTNLYITKVSLKLWKEGNPTENIVCGIRYGAGKSEPDLATAELTSNQITATSPPGDWYEFSFNPPLSLNLLHQTEYFLCVRQANNGGDSTNNYHWRYGGDYPNGSGYRSNDGGQTWASTSDHHFQVKIELLEKGEFSIDGCSCENLLFSNPNGEFSIIRRFKNVSGASIDVKELGLYASGVQQNQPGYPFLIARDVLATPITVPNGNILQVTYKIKITV